MVSFSDLVPGRAQNGSPSSPLGNMNTNYENSSTALQQDSGTSLRANEQNDAFHSETLIESNSSLTEPNYQSNGESSPTNISDTAAETEAELEGQVYNARLENRIRKLELFDFRRRLNECLEVLEARPVYRRHHEGILSQISSQITRIDETLGSCKSAGSAETPLRFFGNSASQ